MSRNTDIKIYSFVFGALATNTMLALFHVVNEALLKNNSSIYLHTVESTVSLMVGVGMFRHAHKFMRQTMTDDETIEMQEMPTV